MARDYHLSEDGERRGPVTRHEVIEGIQGGDLHPGIVLGWHREAPGWVPLGEMPEFEGITLAPVERTVTGSDPEDAEEVGEMEDPASPDSSIPVQILLRGLARSFDFLLVYYPVTLLSALLLPTGSPNPLLGLALFMVTLCVLVWLEMKLVSRTGTTPGKRLMGFDVHQAGEEFPEERRIFSKALLLWPIALLAAPLVLISWWRRGMAPWERQGGVRVRQRFLPRKRNVVLTSVLVALHLLLFMAASVAVLMRAADVKPAGMAGPGVSSPSAAPEGPDSLPANRP